MDQISLYLTLIPALPLAAAVIVAVLGPKLLKENSHWPVIVALGLSFLCSLLLLNEVRRGNETPAATLSENALEKAGFEHVVTLWTWADIPNAYEQTPQPGNLATIAGGARDFRIDVTLRADGLTSMMLSMVTFVSTLVAIFAAGYMHGERGYWRFFSYIALFVFSMTMLVSVSNFVLLFVFWEAVGACSYLLIGFWYQKPEAAAAGKKAFLVNRIGDFGFALAIFLIWANYGTLNFHDSMSDGATEPAKIQAAVDDTGPPVADAPILVKGVVGRARILSGEFVTGTIATAICLLLMLGACGKSAQFPLHVWLPDAMEGPTPVSALIHAATMVTAGVYMVTRCTPLFMMSPDAQMVVSIIGAFTALLAGLIALTQYDLKRVLAYSTISQLGYMFLALGTGTYAGITAGMFHLFTHAFFKALLFLGSGSVMHAMHHIIDMRRFSGLRHIMPQTHWTFLVGCLALAGVFPLAGFWSKDSVVASVHDKAHELSHAGHQEAAHGEEHPAPVAANSQLVKLSDETAQRYGAIYQALYYVALFTAFLTAFYTFRGFFMTFYGEEVVPHEAHHPHESPPTMTIPLMILAVATVVIPLVFITTTFAGNTLVDFIGHAPSLAAGAVHETVTPPKFHMDVAGISTLLAIVGILLAMFLYMGDRSEAAYARSFFDFERARQFTDVQWVAQLKQRPMISSLHRGLKSIGLGWVASLVGLVLGIVAVIIALPITIGIYISPYRLSLGKFFFDELYNWFIVKPTELLAQVLALLDRYLVDGLVNFIGAIPRMLGGMFRSLQMGLVQFYALAMMLGAIVLLTAGILWAAK